MADDTVDYTYEYLPWRGISKETMAFYDVLTKISPEGEPIEIGYPYANDAYKIRKLKEKEFYARGQMAGSPGLFGKDRFPGGSARSVTVVEGEGDALAFTEIFGRTYPVVSPKFGAAGAKRDCIADRDYLNSFEKIYLCLDADEPGQKATREIAQLFDFNKVYHVKLEGGKDALEFLETGRAEQFKRIWWNSQRFLPTGIISSYDQVFDILRNDRKKESTPYPFETLNTLTEGIRTGESVLFTALEGVGKTEILRAIEYAVIKNTDGPVGIIHLEEPKAQNLKRLIGLELNAPIHRKDFAVSFEDMERAYKNLSKSDNRIHFYNHFGSDDPNVILDTIRFLVTAVGCRFVTLDHLNMVVSGLADEDKTRALDYLSTRLEMMVKELDFALMFVAHVNDDGKTRDSRMISKVCDIRVDLFRDVAHENEVMRNLTHLVISKNRPTGLTGPAGRLLFSPETFTLAEVKEEVPVE